MNLRKFLEKKQAVLLRLENMSAWLYNYHMSRKLVLSSFKQEEEKKEN